MALKGLQGHLKSHGIIISSVADPDPDPDPPDQHVFGPPGSGSGSISQRYGSGSGTISQMYPDPSIVQQK
jgi:hypothetical protein